MTVLVALLALASAPDLTQATDQLFHHSDVKGAAQTVDQILRQHPDDPEALELGVIAHAALGDDGQVNALAARRAARGDARALPVLLFAWERAHTSHDDAALLLGVAKPLLPKLSIAEAAPLRRVIGQLERMLGQFDGARADAKLPGQLTDWQIIGSFENDQNLGFGKIYPPEEKVDLAATYPGKVGEVRWRPLLTVNWDGTLCLTCTEFPKDWGVAYLATWVQSPRDADAAVWSEADDHLKIWVNHRLATSDDSTRRAAEGQTRAGIRLHAGWNQILVKVSQQENEWLAGLRITNLRGEPFEGLTASAQAHDSPRAGESEAWPEAPSDPIDAMLSKDKAVLPGSYLKAWRLFDLGHSRASGQAFQILAARGPACSVCLEGEAFSAGDDEDRDAALADLSKAVDQDHGFSRASVERAGIHWSMGLADQAERESKSAIASNPRNAEALALLSVLRLKRGYHAEAARLADAAIKILPGWPAYAEARAGAASEEGDRALAESLLRSAVNANPAFSRSMGELGQLLKTDGRIDQAAKLYEDWLAHDPQATATRQELALLRIDAHGDDQARQQIAELRRLDPDAPTADHLEGDLAERRGDRAAAVVAYRKALALLPSDWLLRDHLDILDPTTEIAQRYQVTEAEVQRRAHETIAHNFSDANAVVLLDELTFLAHEDGSIRVRHHFAVKVFDQAGIEHHLNFDVGTDPSLRLELAATLDKDGVPVHEVSSIDRGQVHFSQVAPGSTFEIIYSFDLPHRAGSDWEWLRGLQEADPSLENRWIVLEPKAKKLRTWKRGKLIDERHESAGESEVVLFDARNEPGLGDEPNHPPLSSFADLAAVSTFQDWDAVAQWVRGSVDDQLALDVEEADVKALARNLTSRAKTTDEKVIALADYVRHDIHYNQADTDIYRWRAHPARRIIETLYGDCKDKATLFEALARNVGLQVDHAVLMTNNIDTTPTEIPLRWFDHAVAYLPPQPGLSHPGLLDLTARDMSVGVVPFMDQGANALVFRPGVAGSRLERIPFSSPEDAKRKLTLKLEVQANGTASGFFQGRMSGLAAMEFRSDYRNTRERSTSLDELANSVFTNVERVGKETVTGLDDPQKDVEIAMKVNASKALRTVEDGVLLKLSDLTTDLKEWTEQSARQQPLRLNSPRENTIHREIILPKQMTLGPLPAPVHVDNGFFSFELTAKRIDGRTIAVDTRYQRKVAEISAAQFPDFRKAVIEVAHAADVDLVLHPASKAQIGER